MIDTVQYRQPRYLRESASRRNWNIETVMREIIDSDGLEDEQLCMVRGVHKHTGIRFFGNRDQIINVQASLPRLLFGHNGKLLRSQAEIAAAFRKLNRTLDKISHPPEGPRVFKRIDLVWHVPGHCAEFIAAHQKVRHPRVRKATCVYDGESVTWRGSAFSLMIYDKSKKELGQPGEFVRVEVQLRQHMLDEFLGELETELDFIKCYRYFRRLVLQLEPAASFRTSSLASLLAACQPCHRHRRRGAQRLRCTRRVLAQPLFQSHQRLCVAALWRVRRIDPAGASPAGREVRAAGGAVRRGQYRVATCRDAHAWRTWLSHGAGVSCRLEGQHGLRGDTARNHSRTFAGAGCRRADQRPQGKDAVGKTLGVADLAGAGCRGRLGNLLSPCQLFTAGRRQ